MNGFCYVIRFRDCPGRTYYPLGQIVTDITAGLPFSLPHHWAGPLLVFATVDDAMWYVERERSDAQLDRTLRFRPSRPLLADTLTRSDVSAELWACAWQPWAYRLPRLQERPVWFWYRTDTEQRYHRPPGNARVRLANTIILRRWVLNWSELPEEPLFC
jgi:hypothetical protein